MLLEKRQKTRKFIVPRFSAFYVRYSGGFMFKKHHSKTMKMFIGTVVAAGVVGGMVFGSQIDFNNALTSISSDESTMVVEATAPVVLQTGYELTINDVAVGIISSEVPSSLFLEEAEATIINAIGYIPEFDYTLNLREIKAEEIVYIGERDLQARLKMTLYESIGEIMVKACVLKIDEFVVSLESQEALTHVLEHAQSLYVQDDSAINVKLEQDEHNPMVLTPEVSILSKALPEERIFVTSSMYGEPMENMEADGEEFLEAVVREVKLEQEIMVVETYVYASEIVDVDTAIELITKEHETMKVYKVVSGDVPSVIAEKNQMETADLYDMNPGLKENSRRIQIGDELTVMIPEPELYVTTVEDVIYTELIDRDIIYKNNPDEYIGTNTVIKPGSDGVIEVRATIEKLNGKTVSHEVTEQTKVLDPVTETQSRGVKALPVTTATGTFEVPMLTYTFTSSYGYRWGRLHKGIDLAAPTGTAIKASDGGRIIKAGWDNGYGYAIEIDHGGGMTTKYAHCSALYVAVGDEVSQYETIAAVGNTGNSTGPHLHFEIREWNTAVDPEIYINP